MTTPAAWYWYVPVWLFGVVLFYHLAGYDVNKPQPFYIAIPQAFDFMLHEMAHIVTAFLPAILTAAAGSFSELLLGLVLIFTAIKTRGYFALMVCMLWFMLACQSVGVYMADARAQRLELFSLGGAMSGSESVIHDWHFIFGRLHMLRFDTMIGGLVRGFGDLVGFVGLAFAAWLLYKMAASAGQKDTMLATQNPNPANRPTARFEVREGNIYPVLKDEAKPDTDNK